VQAGGGGVMVWLMFSWHTLGPSVPIGHRLIDHELLSIVSDHVHPFMAFMYPFSDGFFQQDNWFLEHDIYIYIYIYTFFSSQHLFC